ncbi:MAG: COG1361 S-layer family protein [Candidatus Methanospirareceae archaeon]
MSEKRKSVGVIVITLLVAGALSLLTPVSGAAEASIADRPAVMVTDYSVEPAVLMPGDTGTVSLTLKNPFIDYSSSETETNVDPSGATEQTTTTTSSRGMSAEIKTIRLSSKSQDTRWLAETTDRTQYLNLGTLGPGESMSVSLPITVQSYAPDGTYFPEVYIEVDNGDNVRFPFKVEIDSSEVVLLEEDIPSVISLGESRTVEIMVANNRPNLVNGVNVLLQSSTADLEFTPQGVYVGNLNAYEQRTVSFMLTPHSTGTQDLTFEATYKNGNNVHHSTMASFITAQISADVKLILVAAPDFVYQGDIARIEFDVANGKAKDIKAVSVVPTTTSGLKLLPSEYFIGDMEVGDIFSASFELHTSDLDVGELTIPFELRYKDVETDKVYTGEGYSVTLEVREPQASTISPTVIAGVAVVLVVVIGLVLWIRARRRRTRELQEK